MKIFYSKKNNGFFSEEYHGDNLPDDAKEISEEYHIELFKGQSEGKIIISDENGLPILSDLNKPSNKEINQQIKNRRLMLYQNESDPLFFQFQRGEIEKEIWINKIKEIKENNKYLPE